MRAAVVAAAGVVVALAGCGTGPPLASKAAVYTPAPQPAIPERTAAVTATPLADGVYLASIAHSGDRLLLTIRQGSFVNCRRAAPTPSPAPKPSPADDVECPIVGDDPPVSLVVDPALIRHVTVVGADGVNYATSVDELVALTGGASTTPLTPPGFRFRNDPFLVTLRNQTAIAAAQVLTSSS